MTKIRVQDGKLLDTLPDGVYEVKKVRKHRSNNQNSFYWWVFLPCLSDSIWEEVEDLHEVLKDKFLQIKQKKVKCPIDKRKYIVLKTQVSTTKLDTKEFEDYMEAIRNYFSKWWWNLPYPDDWLLKYVDTITR
jgi:hypothetical protein